MNAPASGTTLAPAAFLDRDEVLAIARAGAAQGCKEALFTLGDRPEERWPAARRWLDERGYDSTLDYLRACAVAVLEETGLLPHLNPGVLSWAELHRLKPVAPSMGMMLETTATRLWSEPGGPHFGSPDKEPAVRLRVIDDAGRVAVPFTTGMRKNIEPSCWPMSKIGTMAGWSICATVCASRLKRSSDCLVSSIGGTSLTATSRLSNGSRAR